MLNVGFGNGIVPERIIAVISADSAPVKRLKNDAETQKRLIDATQGRKTRTVIITDSNHIVLSALQVETVTQRLNELKSLPILPQPSAMKRPFPCCPMSQKRLIKTL
jgi:regulator of extracellular matrix RemA (YlzA/DUF370 family)